MTEHAPGLYRKYEVCRLHDAEGKHDHCRYFVLDPQHDPSAVVALKAYADACGPGALRADLLRWVAEVEAS